MENTEFKNDARVMSKGQTATPENVIAAPGVKSGDRTPLVVEGGNARALDSAVYALTRLQEQMNGEGKKVGLITEEDVANWITQSRREENAE